MNKTARIASVVVAVALVGVQARRIDKTNPPVESDIAAPADIETVLRRACYNCHSNETVWPWYSNVAPASWLLEHDVSDGRGELNFSTWAAYKPRKRAKKLEEIAEEITEGEMPPWYYNLLHPEAKLADTELEMLQAWIARETTPSRADQSLKGTPAAVGRSSTAHAARPPRCEAAITGGNEAQDRSFAASQSCSFATVWQERAVGSPTFQGPSRHGKCSTGVRL